MKDKREALLDSALELFSSRGFQNTPTSLISKNAGVATGTLFHHFSSKEELINSLYLDCKIKGMSYISERLDDDLDTEGKIRRIWEGMISWALENEDRYIFLIQHQNAACINNSTREEAASEFAPLMSILEDAVSHNLIKDIPRDLLADMIISLLTGSISFFLKNKEKFTDPEYRESAFSVFIDAIN